MNESGGKGSYFLLCGWTNKDLVSLFLRWWTRLRLSGRGGGPRGGVWGRERNRGPSSLSSLHPYLNRGLMGWHDPPVTHRGRKDSEREGNQSGGFGWGQRLKNSTLLNTSLLLFLELGLLVSGWASRTCASNFRREDPRASRAFSRKQNKRAEGGLADERGSRRVRPSANKRNY